VRPEPLSGNGGDGTALFATNRQFYDALWGEARLVPPERFNTWPLVSALLGKASARLEVAPGLRPRLPVCDTVCVDISAAALTRLAAAGGRGVCAAITALPLPDAAFDLIAALDVVEHVDDEEAAFAELARVARADAWLLLSVPLHPHRWSRFDEVVGHRRRYQPERLESLLARYGFAVAESAAFGMRPRSPRVVSLGMWFLAHRRRRAMWWYNHVLMPLGVWRQNKLAMQPGMAASGEIDDILLLCRKTGTARV
jgi:SAM-dependent methyltransferase